MYLIYRRIISPLEIMLKNYKRIIIKDSSINAICYGAKLMLPGVLRYDNGIDLNTEVVIMSTKGEAVAIGYAQMTTAELATCDHGGKKYKIMNINIYILLFVY